MRYPCLRYIQALLLDRLEILEIKQSLLSLEFVIPSNTELAEIEARMVKDMSPDLAKYFGKKRIKLTRPRAKELGEVIKRLRVGPYWRQAYDFQKLVDARQRLDVRTLIEGLLLSTISAEEIVTLANTKFPFLCFTKEDLLIYRDFFFCPEELGSASWYLHLLQADEKEARIKRMILKQPDDHARAKWLCGLPVEFEYEDLLQKLMVDMHFYKEETLASQAVDLNRLAVFAGLMMKAGDRKEKIKPPPDDGAFKDIHFHIEQAKAVGEIAPAAKVHIGPLPDLKSTKSNLISLPMGKKSD